MDTSSDPTTMRRRLSDIDIVLAVAKAVSLGVLAWVGWLMWSTASGSNISHPYSHLPAWHTAAAIAGIAVLVGVAIGVISRGMFREGDGAGVGAVAILTFVGVAAAMFIAMAVYTNTWWVAQTCDGLPC